MQVPLVRRVQTCQGVRHLRLDQSDFLWIKLRLIDVTENVTERAKLVDERRCLTIDECRSHVLYVQGHARYQVTMPGVRRKLVLKELGDSQEVVLDRVVDVVDIL